MRSSSWTLIGVVCGAAAGLYLWLKPSPAIAARIEGDYGPVIMDTAARFDLPSARIAAMVATESSGNPRAIGSSGERGLMQVTPGALVDVNVRFSTGYTWDDMLTPGPNLAVGTMYLKLMRTTYFDNIDDSTRAYNAGPKRVLTSSIAGLAYLTKVKNYEKIIMKG